MPSGLGFLDGLGGRPGAVGRRLLQHRRRALRCAALPGPRRTRPCLLGSLRGAFSGREVLEGLEGGSALRRPGSLSTLGTPGEYQRPLWRPHRRRLASEGLVRRTSATASRSSDGIEHLGLLGRLDDHVAVRGDHHRVAGVARAGLPDPDDPHRVLDRPGPQQGAPVLDLAFAGHPGSGYDQRLRAAARPGSGPAPGSAGRSRSSAPPGTRGCPPAGGSSGPAGRSPTRGSRRSRRGGSSGTA